MSGFRALPCLLMCLAVWAASPCAAAPLTLSSRTDIRVALGQGAHTTIELVLPVGRTPKALVIVVPGSGGVTDPYLDAELARSTYDPDSRGGMTAKLLAAGYAAAYYAQRGYAPPRTCISGESPAARALSFVMNCVATEVRARVSLSSITADTGRVFAALAEHRRTKGLPQIALPFSEGMHHVSALVGQGVIQPAGIVSIGGPHVSIAHVARYQTSYEHFAEIAATAFARCPDQQLELESIFRCAGSRSTPQHLARMRELAGGDTLARAQLPLRRQLFLERYEQGLTYQLRLPEDAIMSGTYLGYPMPVAWNARYAQEQQTASKSTLDQLGSFGSKRRQGDLPVRRARLPCAAARPRSLPLGKQRGSCVGRLQFQDHGWRRTRPGRCQRFRTRRGAGRGRRRPRRGRRKAVDGLAWEKCGCKKGVPSDALSWYALLPVRPQRLLRCLDPAGV
jgi:hypothetical protein